MTGQHLLKKGWQMNQNTSNMEYCGQRFINCAILDKDNKTVWMTVLKKSLSYDGNCGQLGETTVHMLT